MEIMHKKQKSSSHGITFCIIVNAKMQSASVLFFTYFFCIAMELRIFKM